MSETTNPKHHDGDRAADEAESEANQTFRAAFEAGLDPISINSLEDGAYLDVNREFERLSGLGRSQILGRTPPDLGLWADPASYDAFLDGIEHDGEIRDHPADFHGKDRSVVSTLVSARVVGVNGRRAVISFLRDATDLRVREREAAEAVREATEGAELAREESRRVLAHASHEIRAPLNGLLGFSELLRGTALSAEQTSYLDALDRAGHELLTLVNGILDLSNAEGGVVELAATEVDLGEVVGDTARTAVARAGEKDLEITGRLMPGAPPRVIGDPDRFRSTVLRAMPVS